MTRVDLFDYHLPRRMIAQAPLAARDQSRLLLLKGDQPEDRSFVELPDILRAGDLLVLNDTRVFPARIMATRIATRGRVEILFMHPCCTNAWQALTRSGGRLNIGEKLRLEPDGPVLTLIERKGLDGDVLQVPEGVDIYRLLEDRGQVPLPPYIKRPSGPDATDAERYQTVYARQPGAVAAPTAGLHFTQEMLDKLQGQGIAHTYITLHVGPGTFRPVKEPEIEKHRITPERFCISAAAADAINNARAQRRRIIAVGTTVVRTLESVANSEGLVKASQGEADLFIYPPCLFRVIDGLLTNFHLPRSTLLMLVCAFAGRKRVLTAYEHAKAAGYRFFSYGDAMLVLKGNT